MQMENSNKVLLPREELYKMVWVQPMVSLEKKYDISAAELRSICKDMRIPLPKSGHWGKIAFGKFVEIPELPDAFTGKQSVELVLREENQLPIKSASILLQEEIEANRKINLKVPDRLRDPDKLIVAVRESLTTQQHNRYEGMVEQSYNELDIRVAPDSIERALCFMDTFIKAFRSRGHNIAILNNETFVVYGKEKVQIKLREKRRKIPLTKGKYPSFDSKPTGLVYIKAGRFAPKEWIDGKLSLEEQLSRIIAAIELMGQEEEAKTVERNKWNKQREEVAKAQREIFAKQKKEADDFNALIEEAERWRKADTVRDYLAAVEGKAVKENAVTEEFIKWLKWARLKTEEYDPIKLQKDFF